MEVAERAQALVEAAGVTPDESRWIPIHGTVPGGLPGVPVSRDAVIAPEGPGMWRLEAAASDSAAAAVPLTFITVVPFSEKRAGRIKEYHIGTYPTENSPRDGAYAPPEGFIEITASRLMTGLCSRPASAAASMPPAAAMIPPSVEPAPAVYSSGVPGRSRSRVWLPLPKTVGWSMSRKG